MSQDVGRSWLSQPFHLEDGAELTSLHRALENAGYTESAVDEAVLHEHLGRPFDLHTALLRTADGTPFHTLIRLFILAQTVPEPAVRTALAPASLEDLVALGLLQGSPEGIRALAAIKPEENLLLVREFWPEILDQPMSHDFVLGVGPASRNVGYLAVHRQDELALDLGTGAGFLAFQAARHAHRVLATDINPRALNFAAFNARLNQIDNVEFRQGSLFEPVADCRFDLIMTNPPFVISPKSDFEYRDSGRQGDALCEEILRQTPQMLREGGWCTVLFNWHHRGTDDWADRPMQWIHASGCDAWLLGFETIDPIGYAGAWLGRQYLSDRHLRAQAQDEWLAYLERLGAGLITYGAVVLRRRSAAANWVRADRSPSGHPAGPCSAQIQRIFAAEDFLQNLGPNEDLLQARFVLTPDHQLEQVLHAENHHWVVREAHIKQISGYPCDGHVDRLTSVILAGCDGQRTLGELAASLAKDVGADAAEVGRACSEVIRTLLRWGFLTVTSTPAT